MVMASVAKRFIGRLAATTKRNDLSPGKPEGVSGLILDYYVVAHHSKRAVVSAFYDSFILIAH